MSGLFILLEGNEDMKERKTFDESLNDLDKAWSQLKIEIGKMLRIDRFVIWMEKFLVGLI
ncbi:hypothetical protein DQ190_04650 [Enterococcus faecium]|nr:hypothetical protein [Enterococcus faecium]